MSGDLEASEGAVEFLAMIRDIQESMAVVATSMDRIVELLENVDIDDGDGNG